MKIWLQNSKFGHNSRNNKDQKLQKRVYSFKAIRSEIRKFQAYCKKKIFWHFLDSVKFGENWPKIIKN